jgi:hypothetical protein
MPYRQKVSMSGAFGSLHHMTTSTSRHLLHQQIQLGSYHSGIIVSTDHKLHSSFPFATTLYYLEKLMPKTNNMVEDGEQMRK